MALTTADSLIERLIEWGVDTVFGLPGDGVNAIFEALRTHQEQIRFIQVRHEESAAFAACGYAKYTGRLGVCVATSGPGGIHLLNGLYDAKLDNQPVLAITGHTFHDLIGAHYQQDVDLDKLFTDVAVFNERVMGPPMSSTWSTPPSSTPSAGAASLTSPFPRTFRTGRSHDDKPSKANVPRHSGNGTGAGPADARRRASSCARPRCSTPARRWRCWSAADAWARGPRCWRSPMRSPRRWRRRCSARP